MPESSDPARPFRRLLEPPITNGNGRGNGPGIIVPEGKWGHQRITLSGAAWGQSKTEERALRTLPAPPASLSSMTPSRNASTYLVFGDLHGRVLPAFKLAQAWAREHGVAVAGLLQVGDLGYFPDPSRFDKATKRHAAKNALEAGVQ